MSDDGLDIYRHNLGKMSPDELADEITRVAREVRDLANPRWRDWPEEQAARDVYLTALEIAVRSEVAKRLRLKGIA